MFTGFSLAPQVGLEPTTPRLTAACSTIELLRNIQFNCLRFPVRERYTRSTIELLRNGSQIILQQRTIDYKRIPDRAIHIIPILLAFMRYFYGLLS